MVGGVCCLPSSTKVPSFCKTRRCALRKTWPETDGTSPRRESATAACSLHDPTDTHSEQTDVAAFVSALDAPEALGLAPVLAIPEPSDGLALSAEVLGESLSQTLFAKLWQEYLKLLEEKPVLVKSCTSLFGFLIGDICAQMISGVDYDIYRTLRMTLFGIMMDGPIGHCWYLFLDKNIMPQTPRVPKAIVLKTALDQLIWAPFFSCVFFAFNQTLQGHPELSLSTIQGTLIPTLMANYAIWPLAHLINFKFIPSNQRILYINFVQILWTSYLSNLAAKHGAIAHHIQSHAAHPTTLQLVQGVRHHLVHSMPNVDVFHSCAHRFFA